MSDLPKVKNYEVKIRIKNHDLPKARISNKTINFNLHKVRKITKINCRELSTVTSTFLDIHGFRKRQRQGENYYLTQTFIHFQFLISQLLHPELLSIKEYRRISLDKPIAPPELCSGTMRLFYSDLFIYSFIHSFIYLFVCLFVCLFIYFAQIVYGMDRK